MALSRVVSEIFNVEYYRDLDFSVKEQSRSLKVVPFDRWIMLSYYNFVRKLDTRDIRLQKCLTLKIGLRVREGH